MPETAVHKNYRLPFRKNDIQLSRQVLSVKPESESHPVKHRSHNNPGFSIL